MSLVWVALLAAICFIFLIGLTTSDLRSLVLCGAYGVILVVVVVVGCIVGRRR